MNVEQFIKEHQNYGESEELLDIKKNLVEACSNVSQHPRHFKDVETNVHKLLDLFKVEPVVKTPEHYSSSSEESVDVISFTEQELNGFVDAMLFNIIKYTVRLGRKDDEKNEVNKIYNYFSRLKNHLVSEGLSNE